MFVPKSIYFLDTPDNKKPYTAMIIGLNVLYGDVHVVLWRRGFILTMLGRLR